MRGILFNSVDLEIHLRKMLQHNNLKTRPGGGEMCSSDVSVHKRYPEPMQFRG